MMIKSLAAFMVTCFILTACESTSPQSSSSKLTNKQSYRSSCMIKENDRFIPCNKAKNREDPNRLICTNEMITGSKFTDRVCLTAASRKEQSKKHRQLVHQMQNMR